MMQTGRGVWSCLIGVWAGMVLASSAAPCADRSVHVAPHRIASLNLTADEILAEILPAGRMVACTEAADERGTSNVVSRIPSSVTRFKRADLERVLALAPDLVVVSEYTDADFLTLLERSGLPVHRMEGLRSHRGFRSAILSLGNAVGAAEAADRLVARYDAILEDLARRLEGAPRPRVLYWANPMTAGEGTAIGALIEAAGGRNVARELGLSGVVPIGAERAFAADPDIVLVGSGWGGRRGLLEEPLLAKLRAARQDRIVEMPTELLVTMSHHAAEACWFLAHALHPDRVSQARP